MKMFSWMQSKLTGKQRSSNSNASSFNYNHRAKQETTNEEFRDWPHALLAIGTFGNGERGSAKENPPPSSSSEDFPDFTAEEVGKLQEELMKLLSRKPQSRASLSHLKGSSSSSDRYAADLPLDKFLNCPSSLDVDRRISTALCNDPLEEEERDEEDIERTISVILHRCKDLCAEENSKNDKRVTIGKKSISFLLKKMFVCANGFAPPPPTLRHSLQESTMEKLLRTMLHKKLNPRNSHRASSMKKYLGDRHDLRAENEEENKKKAGDGHKWVKTDSEYIVLEI